MEKSNGWEKLKWRVEFLAALLTISMIIVGSLGYLGRPIQNFFIWIANGLASIVVYLWHWHIRGLWALLLIIFLFFGKKILLPLSAFYRWYEIKHYKLPELKRILKKVIIPRLQIKVINRRELHNTRYGKSDYFFEELFERGETDLGLAHQIESCIAITNETMRKDLNKINSHLFSKIDDLYDNIIAYDNWLCRIYKNLLSYYPDNPTYAEEIYYHIFDVPSAFQRQMHKSRRIPSQVNLVKLKKIAEDVKKEAELLIEQCREIVKEIEKTTNK